jgi:hypothetical protein
MTDEPLEPTLPPPEAPQPAQPAETAKGDETATPVGSEEGLISSIREITPSWWEMMLEEGQEEQQAECVAEEEGSEELPELSPAEFELSPEQEGQSLWELAPGLKSLVEETPASLPAPDLVDQAVKLAEDGEPILPSLPLEETAPPESETVLVPEEGPASVWDIVPSWWRVYSEEKTAQDSGDLVVEEQESTGEPTEESLAESTLSTDETEEPVSLWDYAPELQRHLGDKVEPAEREETIEEGTTDVRPPDLPGWFDPNDSIWQVEEEEMPGLAEEGPAGEEEIPEVFNAEEVTTPEAEDESQPVESVWETVPPWWRDYTVASAPEPLEVEPFTEEQALSIEDGLDWGPQEDQERPAVWSEIAPELNTYIEDTISKAQDQAEAVEETDAAAILNSELDLPEDLVEELEKNAAEFDAAHAKRRSALPLILAIGATLVGVLVVVWFGGNALLSAIQEMRAAASVIPTAVPTATPVYPFTQSEFPVIEKIEAANPVALEILPGVIFALQEGQIVAGMWSPQQPEWLPGAELPRVIAIPWQEEYVPIVTSLDIGNSMRLAMSNRVIEQYKVTGLDLVARDQTGLLNDNKPSLLIIFSRDDDQERWVIFCERVQ